MTESERGPRERMVFSAAQLIRRRGVAGAGMRDVVAHAHAPRGSLQHYFPGGKEQLVNEAVRWAGRYAAKRVARFVAEMAEPTPSGLFAAMVGQWTEEFAREGFAGGCPVVAATVGCAESVESTRVAAAGAFGEWVGAVGEALVGMGVPVGRAGGLAVVMVSAVEGAVVVARAERDVRALEAVVGELGVALDAAVDGR
ncbi:MULTISPECIES: TetR/AcrR family transcriptional regulator [unclassified Streptomyces]|uniref:TetR/AcrR family transcriptional regulator n=1 Tax=unclassified Streptomyces TaxID=2593676 RepID=UPI0004C7E77E|nr:MULTISPECIES: TetR/AcrR family transcriptional regulator [unclassified Streptomyces]